MQETTIHIGRTIIPSEIRNQIINTMEKLGKQKSISVWIAIAKVDKSFWYHKGDIICQTCAATKEIVRDKIYNFEGGCIEDFDIIELTGVWNEED